MTDQLKLLTPVKLGAYQLKNRMVMAPLTRRRARQGNIPHEMNAHYYAQRASAGLIVSEASQISPQGQGYAWTPGIHSPEQIEGWKLVTDAVHQKGGYIFMQLWHVGRISHPSLQPEGKLPVAPSAIRFADLREAQRAAEGMATTVSGEQPFVTPRALETEEIPQIVEQYRQAAQNALQAGFDGVEIHGANGYLIDQFLHDGSNQRSDHYGGSIQNRARLLMEITEAVIGVWGADKVGVRLSPGGIYNSMSDSNLEALFNYVVSELNRFNLAYLHIVEPRIQGREIIEEPESQLGVKHFRSFYQGTLITAGGYTRDTGEEVLQAGDADLVAYGRLFIANPDLPERFALNGPLNPYDRSTFYGGDEKGYIDYPFLEESWEQQAS